MKSVFEEYCKQLDKGVDRVRADSKKFRETLGLTGFAYVRVYHDGRLGWLTSDSDHDRMLIERGHLESDPLIDTAELLREGHYLWFHNRTFPGCESFYSDREKFFHLDHGVVIVNHKEGYLETGCFSGSLSKRPLYNLFLQEKGLFHEFLNYFSSNLNRSFLPILEEGLHISDIKTNRRTPQEELTEEKRKQLVAMLKPELLKLSKREKECLFWIHQHLTYEEIGGELGISERTVEHYLQSVKDKLNIDSRSELFEAAQKLTELGL